MAQQDQGGRKLSFMDGLMFGCGFYTAGFIFGVILLIVWIIIILALSALGMGLGNLMMQQGF